ncbi:MAG: lipoprotein-releasing system ATP-binding protein LolD [Deltaproteobacteria bacterium]|nr:MAG: lipoprotein-releasing system ATP-binding protein LolD [Deltaproteobacteria bacterium]
MTAPLLEATSLGKSYAQPKGSLEVLKGISLTVKSGERVAIVGPSGAGKSTLLHLLGALDRPTSGSLTFEGEDIFKRADSELAKFRNSRIGFVFQFHHLLPEFTAEENVAIPAMIGGIARGKALEGARELLDAVGLSERLTHRPAELSGGEQQRVSLARALSMKPGLLLADEPTGNLDFRNGELVHKLLLEMNRRYGVTLIVATHNPELAAATDRTITIEDGLIVKEEDN